MIILRAQHLRADVLGELLRAVGNAEIAHLSLIYNRAIDPPHGSTTTIAQLLERAPPSPIDQPAPVWPLVPRSPALRLRYDCRSTLVPDEFLRVDELLHTTITLAERWLARHPRPSLIDLQAACAVLAFAMSPDQAHIRASALEIALTTAGIRKPAPTRPDLPGTTANYQRNDPTARLHRSARVRQEAGFDHHRTASRISSKSSASIR